MHFIARRSSFYSILMFMYKHCYDPRKVCKVFLLSGFGHRFISIEGFFFFIHWEELLPTIGKCKIFLSLKFYQMCILTPLYVVKVALKHIGNFWTLIHLNWSLFFSIERNSFQLLKCFCWVDLDLDSSQFKFFFHWGMCKKFLCLKLSDSMFAFIKS